ncbi:MAG: alpha/beta hydrolase [Acidimicrobiia bacterium]
MTASVVLVHGAWQGAWCFDRVLARLRDAGIEAVAVDLPGHGSDRARSETCTPTLHACEKPSTPSRATACCSATRTGAR